MKTLQFRLFLIIFGFCALAVCANEIPILDLSTSHSYSLIAQGGISASPRNPKTSQFILDTNLQVKLGSDRVFTIDLQHFGSGVFYCLPEKTNIEFVLLASTFSNMDQIEQKFGQMNKAFRWGDADFTNWSRFD